MTKESVIDDTLTTAPEPVVASLTNSPTEKGYHVTVESTHDDFYELQNRVRPTEEELAILPKIAGKLPWTSYMLCGVEFAERASYYGCYQVFKNFIRGSLPIGGNGAGAPPRGSQKTAGALGKGTVIAGAMTDAFKFLAYAVPLFSGWLADKHWGRFKTICVGVAVCGVAHIIMVASAAPKVIQSGHAIGPFALSLYMLSIGAALFKPNISPTVLDQNPHLKPHVVVRKDGSKAIVDPEATSESIMLWFYFMINVGAFFGVPTAYLAKYVGFWAAYLLPGLIYFLLPILLWMVNKRLVKAAPGGSDLGNFMKVNWLCLRKAGIRGFGRKGYFERAKPSVLAASGDTRKVTWDDDFVEDTRRTMGACAVFLFFPIQQINDGGLGAAANAQSAALTSNGVPNDVLDNFNPLAIIVLIPIMNHGIYPLLRKWRIRFGPIKRMTFGFLIASIGASSYAVIQHYIYITSPCGEYATDCEIGTGVSHLSLWIYAIPTGVTACSEVFINITAYGMAYSRAPPRMKGFVSAISLFMTAISTAISMATADALHDPNFVVAFAVPSGIGFVTSFIFYYLFRHYDEEDFFVHVNDAPMLNVRRVDSEEEHSSLGEKGDTKV